MLKTELINESSNQDVLKGRVVRLDYDITKQKFTENDTTYVLYHFLDILGINDDEYVINLLSDTLSKFLKNCKKVLVVGLGNRHINSDSFGSFTINRIIATRNLAKTKREVSVISPSVFGLTGIESADIVKSVCEIVRPDVVVLIDTLCASDYHNLINNIQISDYGFDPGAGVGNKRKNISFSTLGIKTISIGVPLVVYAKTLVNFAVEKNLNQNIDPRVLNPILKENFDNLVVTTKDVDIVIKKLSFLVSSAINLACNDYSIEDQKLILGSF